MRAWMMTKIIRKNKRETNKAQLKVDYAVET